LEVGYRLRNSRPGRVRGRPHHLARGDRHRQQEQIVTALQTVTRLDSRVLAPMMPLVRRLSNADATATAASLKRIPPVKPSGRRPVRAGRENRRLRDVAARWRWTKLSTRPSPAKLRTVPASWRRAAPMRRLDMLGLHCVEPMPSGVASPHDGQSMHASARPARG
jgi:hypothetical protein